MNLAAVAIELYADLRCEEATITNITKRMPPETAVKYREPIRHKIAALDALFAIAAAAQAVSGNDAEYLAEYEETFCFNQPKRAVLVDALRTYTEEIPDAVTR